MPETHAILSIPLTAGPPFLVTLCIVIGLSRLCDRYVLKGRKPNAHYLSFVNLMTVFFLGPLTLVYLALIGDNLKHGKSDVIVIVTVIFVAAFIGELYKDYTSKDKR